MIAEIGSRVDRSGIVDWEEMRRHRSIRQVIARVIPGFEAMADIDDTKKEFHITGRTFHEPRFPTPGGRARFHAVPIPPLRGEDGLLRLMTVRSEGQFNTVVYDDEDTYRGQGRRDVIMMSAGDILRLGLTENTPVTVEGESGTMENVLVRRIDITPGNCVMYYPEANVLLARDIDPTSRTPGFKNGLVSVVAPATVSPGTQRSVPI